MACLLIRMSCNFILLNLRVPSNVSGWWFLMFKVSFSRVGVVVGCKGMRRHSIITEIVLKSFA